MDTGSSGLVEGARELVGRGNKALDAKLNTNVSRGLHSRQMTENVRKIVGRQAGNVMTDEQAESAKLVEGAKKLVSKGNESLGAKLDTNVSRGLNSAQMVENSTNIVKTTMEQAGTKAQQNPRPGNATARIVDTVA